MLKVFTKNGDLYQVDIEKGIIITPNGGVIKADNETINLFLIGARYLNYPILDVDKNTVKDLLSEIPDIFSEYKIISELDDKVIKTIPTKYGLAIFFYDKKDNHIEFSFCSNFKKHDRILEEIIEMVLEGKITLQKI